MTELSPRYSSPWCVWDHRKKCPDKKSVCGSEEREQCNHFNNEGGNHCLNLKNPNSYLFEWAKTQSQSYSKDEVKEDG